MKRRSGALGWVAVWGLACAAVLAGCEPMLVSEDAPTARSTPAIETLTPAEPTAPTRTAAEATTAGVTAADEAVSGEAATPSLAADLSTAAPTAQTAAPRATPEEVADLRGTIYSLPAGSAYDDMVVLHDRHDLHVGIMSFDAQLDLELQALRDSGQTLRLWGLFYAQAEDYGGGRLVVNRFAIEPATFTPTATALATDTDGDDDGETMTPTLTATATDLPAASRTPSSAPAASATPGSTATATPGRTATAIPGSTATRTATTTPMRTATPTRTAAAITPSATPVPTSQTVNGWTGTIHSAESGSPYDDYFALAGDGGERYGLVTSYGRVSRRITALRDSGLEARIWGVLNYGIDDYDGCQIIVVRIEQTGS